MNHLVLPDGVSFTMSPVKQRAPKKGAKRVPVRMFRFKYVETFENPPPGLVQKTHDMLAPMLSKIGLKVSMTKKTIGISGVTTRERIGDMMVGEFMPWSGTGQIKLQQLFEGNALGQIYVAQQRALEDANAAFKATLGSLEPPTVVID
jgi:hypothetical protein